MNPRCSAGTRYPSYTGVTTSRAFEACLAAVPNEDVAWFFTSDSVLGLYPRDLLAEEAKMAPRRGRRFRRRWCTWNAATCRLDSISSLLSSSPVKSSTSTTRNSSSPDRKVLICRTYQTNTTRSRQRDRGVDEFTGFPPKPVTHCQIPPPRYDQRCDQSGGARLTAWRYRTIPVRSRTIPEPSDLTSPVASRNGGRRILTQLRRLVLPCARGVRTHRECSRYPTANRTPISPYPPPS